MDSVRALMLIRAYRMRGHLHAKLDPLGIAAPVATMERVSFFVTGDGFNGVWHVVKP